jgi:hypothetical protein
LCREAALRFFAVWRRRACVLPRLPCTLWRSASIRLITLLGRSSSSGTSIFPPLAFFCTSFRNWVPRPKLLQGGCCHGAVKMGEQTVRTEIRPLLASWNADAERALISRRAQTRVSVMPAQLRSLIEQLGYPDQVAPVDYRMFGRCAAGVITRSLNRSPSVSTSTALHRVDVALSDVELKAEALKRALAV